MKVSVIIPFKDKVELTRDCFVSFMEINREISFEVLLVDNNSRNSSREEIKRIAQGYKKVQLLSYPYPYNFQKICNFGVTESDGEILYFLNNDTEFIPQSQGLLARMVEKCTESQIGAVGSLLLYEDGITVQHAGVFYQPGGYAGHIDVGKTVGDSFSGAQRYMPLADGGRIVSAVTAASLVVERSKFEEVGGFSENFLVCGGDVDLCIKLNLAGYRSYLIDSGYIIHKESKSVKGMKIAMNDFIMSYKSYIRNFDLDKGDLHHNVNGDI